MIKTILAAGIAALAFATSASAATVGGTFSVFSVNVSDVNAAESSATLDNFFDAQSGALGAFNGADEFEYEGLLDFRVGGGNTAGTSIEDFLDTGTGTVSDLDSTFGDLQLSNPNIKKGSATTTFFAFLLQDVLGAGTLTFTHDDGIRAFELTEGGPIDIGSSIDEGRPTGERVTQIEFGGGQLAFIYVATNGNPSVLEVDLAPVPLPASLSFLLAGFGGLALLRRRNKTA